MLLSRGRGRIIAPSFAGDLRRGRDGIERVVARRRWLQKRQWWVWTGRRGEGGCWCWEGVVVVVVVVEVGGGGVGADIVGGSVE